MGGRWRYSCCFLGCCFQELFNIARSILTQLPSSFFSIQFVSVYVVHPYNSMDTTAAWKKLRFISSDRSDFHMNDNLSIADHAFTSRVLGVQLRVCKSDDQPLVFLLLDFSSALSSYSPN